MTNGCKNKIPRKGKPSLCFGRRIGCFEGKLILFVEDSQRQKLLHFQFLMQYRDKTGATVDTNYFSSVIKNLKIYLLTSLSNLKQTKPL